MGLDMYLEARKYVSKGGFEDGELVTSPEFMRVASFGPDGMTKYSDFAGATVCIPIGYWRKANAIHGWFVRECGGGVDECQDIYVPREKLVELRDLCKSVIKQPAMAGDILPPTSGFFFGSYEIDEWYMQDMKKTIEMLDHVLDTLPDNWDWSFYYHASW